MKKLLSLIFSLILLGGTLVFAQPTTDLDIGGTFVYCSMNYNETTPDGKIEKVSTAGIGLTGCLDIEVIDNVAVFVDMGYITPEVTRLHFNNNGKKTSEKTYEFPIVGEVYGVLGAEYIFHINENFKVTVGGGFDISVIVMQQKQLDINKSDFLYGLDAKADCVYYFSDFFGLKGGLNTALLFGGYSRSIKSVNRETVISREPFDKFSVSVQPNISAVIHFGGLH